MKNQKGFTLVELLVVITIMGLLMTICIPGVLSISSSIKKKMYCTKIQTLESAAVLWGQDNIDILQTIYSEESHINVTQTNSIISVQKLIDGFYIKKEDLVEGTITNPIDNASMNSLTIKVYIKNSRVHAKIPDAISNCT